MNLITLAKRWQILNIKKSNIRYVCKDFIIVATNAALHKDDDCGVVIEPRFVFVVSKRNGNAVRRNFIKRRLRMVVRGWLDDTRRNNIDYMIIAKTNAGEQSYVKLEEKFAQAMVFLGKQIQGKQIQGKQIQGKQSNDELKLTL